MRLAILLVPPDPKGSTAKPGRAPTVADLFADRLSEPDAAFEVEVVEAKGRAGERVRRCCADRRNGTGPVLVVVSGRVARDDDGEPGLELASESGATLSFTELRATIAGASDRALLVVDAVHDEDPEDPTVSVSWVGAIRDAIEPKESGIGLLLGARPSPERRPNGPSPFARALLAALEHAGKKLGRTGQALVSSVYDGMRADHARFHEIAAAGFFPGREDFPLLVQPSIVIGGAESGPPMRASSRPAALRSGPPSLPPAASPAVEEAWTAGSTAVAEGRHQEAIEHYKRALLLLGTKPERAELYFRIGRAKEALGSAAEAVHNYDKALAIEALHREAFDRAAALLRRSKDFGHLERLLARRAAAQSEPAARARELRQIATMWLDEAQDAKQGAAALEQLLKLGEDTETLELLARARGALGRHAQANEARKRLAARLEAEPIRRARVLAEAARAAAEHLPNGADAVELARKALELDPGTLEAIEVASTELGKRRRWKELAELYQGVVGRIGEPQVAWDLAKKLGMLYRDQLDDAAGARRAFELAAQSNPADLELHFWLTEMAEAERDYARAALQMRAAARAAPADPNVLRRALWCFEKTGEADSAWNAACVLDQVGEADINESLLADQHRPEGLIAARGTLGEGEWTELRPERDPELEALIELVRPAAIALRVAEVERKKLLPALDDATRQSPQGTTTLARSLVWTSRLLGVPAPVLHVLPAFDGDLVPLPLAEPTAAASRSVASGLGLPELAFLWGRVLGLHRPAHEIAVFYPSLAAVAKLVLAALELGRAERGELGEGASELAIALGDELDAKERERLVTAVSALEPKRLRARVERWVRSVHCAAGRAGLLACGDVALACELARRFPPLGEITSEDQIADLRAFAVSAEYAALREHIGVAVHNPG